MDAFFFASIVSFILTLLMLASTATLAGKKFDYSIGDKLKFEADRPLFFLITFGVAVVLVVVIILFSVGRIHPQQGAVYSWSDFVAGRLFTSVVLGLLFGSLFAFWLRDLLWVKEKEVAGWRPVVQTVVLAVLLLIGAFSDILVSYAYRISQINIAGTQVTFTPSKDDAREQPGLGGVAQNVGNLAPGASVQALGLIKGITDFVLTDATYMNDLFPPTNFSSAVTSAPEIFVTFANFGNCLKGVADENPQDTLIDAQLRAFAAPLREVVIARRDLTPERREMIAQQFVQIAKALRDHIKVAYPQVKCMDIANPRPPEVVLKQLNLLLDDEVWFTHQPYPALLYAGVLWRLGDYMAAVHEVDAWLHKAEDTKEIHPWKKIRARIYVGIMVEEWIRRSGGLPPGLLPPGLFEYHLGNLQSTIELMRPLINRYVEAIGDSKDDVEREGFRQRAPVAGFQCSNLLALIEKKPAVVSAEYRTQLNNYVINLVLTWLRQHIVFSYRATQLPDYFDRYLAPVTTYLHFAIRKDVFCLKNTFPDSGPYVDIYYADALYTVAEVELANVARIQSLPDREAVKRSLDRALQAVNLGLSLVKPHAENDRNESRDATSLIKKLEPKKSQELEQSLRDIQQRITRKLKAL